MKRVAGVGASGADPAGLLRDHLDPFSLAMPLRTLTALVLVALAAAACATAARGGPRAYYVDRDSGSDDAAGTLAAPFRTLDQALRTVGERVDRGLRSDTIYLREGVYRKGGERTLWMLNLHGTPEARTVLSAMPAEPGAPGAVRRRSGRWYERVVFDDGQPITTPWTRVEGRSGVWQTNPGFTNLEWTHQNVWPWRRWESAPFPLSEQDATPTTTSFTIAPYMLLQDGEPFLWVDRPDQIDRPGMRTYDHRSGVLYVWPHGGKDPNTAVMETWYGGPEHFREGILYLDGDGRALFDGDMQHAELRGFEFRMFARLFEFRRHGYDRAEDRGVQRHVLVEDNEFRYGWTHFLIDSNTVHGDDPPGAPFIPRYDDRSDWLVRNNLFFRPSREVFQVHGDDHVFEHNLVIDHLGPWAGPAGVVGAINARNMRNFTMRYNVFEGQANVPGYRGSILMIEVGDEAHADENGDYVFGNLTVEHNLFLNSSGSSTLVLGKGKVRMRDISVRRNVFDTNLHGAAIQISSPQQNLVIENNTFLRQNEVIRVLPVDEENPMQSPPSPSTIAFRGNILAENRRTIAPALFDVVEGSTMDFSRNLFHGNGGEAVGTAVIAGDPLFRAPDVHDYRLRPGSPAIAAAGDLGAYDSAVEAPPAARWWEILRDAPRAIAPGSFGLDAATPSDGALP